MLFRFLQLLCEGHNEDFQNYLRTQVGNNTSVNIVISTVDYLLRLQESVSDFYWYYSSKDQIDDQGKEHFSSAIEMAKQVFNSLTEYIQGPCFLNQSSLAHSRLWDAVVGFWHVFAQLQSKLSKDSGNSLNLLSALLDLQQDMIVMLLSMLEGNIVNGNIGRQLLDTLIEAQQDVGLIIKYFTMFLKLSEVVETEKFKEIDLEGKGIITKREFHKQLESAKNYDPEEIEYVLKCIQPDENDKFNYKDFVDQFHKPAEEIGFNFALLLTSLHEHSTNDNRLDKFLDIGKELLDYFESNLGRIEILGKSKRIERIYFNIQQSSLEQWEKPQIRDSKRAFIFDVIAEGGENGKMEEFVSFCENTIFEMQLAASISQERDDDGDENAEQGDNEDEEHEIQRHSFWDSVKHQFRMILGKISYFFTARFFRNAFRTLRHTTVRDFVVFIFIVIYRAIKLFGRMIASIGKFVGQWLLLYLFSSNLIDMMKENTITGIIQAIPEPTQEGIGTRHEDDVAEEEDEEEEEEEDFEEEAIPVIGEAFGITLKADSTAAFTSYVEDKSWKGFGDQDFDEAARNLGMEYDETAFNQQVEAQAIRDRQRRNSEIGSANKLKSNAKQSSWNDFDSTAGTWQTYRNPCPRPLKYTSIEETKEEISPWKLKFQAFSTAFLAFFARNYYNFKSAALIISFLLNCILLSLRWESEEELEVDEHVINETEVFENNLDQDDQEFGDQVHEVLVFSDWMFENVNEVFNWCAFLHTILALAKLVSYYELKVPLLIFKREKDISRKLEFEGLYVSCQPDEDDFTSMWDRLVISCPHFPMCYWDKFVKKKVLEKYGGQFERDTVSELLGLDTSVNLNISPKERQEAENAEKQNKGPLAFITDHDWRYGLWKTGVVLTDRTFLYLLGYTAFSFAGHFNRFFYAASLLDVAFDVKSLQVISLFIIF